MLRSSKGTSLLQYGVLLKQNLGIWCPTYNRFVSVCGEGIEETYLHRRLSCKLVAIINNITHQLYSLTVGELNAVEDYSPI